MSASLTVSEIEARLNLVFSETANTMPRVTVINELLKSEYPAGSRPSEKRPSFFRTHLVGFADNEIEVGLEFVAPDQIDYPQIPNKIAATEIPRLLLIGFIPYTYVVDIQTKGDEFIGDPRIFCRFLGDGGWPYSGLWYHVLNAYSGKYTKYAKYQEPPRFNT